jgi:hypothetical protein
VTGSDVISMSTGNFVTASFAILLAPLLLVPGVLGEDGNVTEGLQSFHTRAALGDTGAQLQLGNYFQSQKQYTNAVLWYRLAAQDGNFSSQLALAGLYIAGRGVSEDRHKAAYWLRRAADSMEQSQGTELIAESGGKKALPPVENPKAIVITRQKELSGPRTNSFASNKLLGSGGSENLFTNVVSRSTREPRADKLVVVEPELQEPNTTPQSSGGSR